MQTEEEHLKGNTQRCCLVQKNNGACVLVVLLLIVTTTVTQTPTINIGIHTTATCHGQDFLVLITQSISPQFTYHILGTAPPFSTVFFISSWLFPFRHSVARFSGSTSIFLPPINSTHIHNAICHNTLRQQAQSSRLFGMKKWRCGHAL